MSSELIPVTEERLERIRWRIEDAVNEDHSATLQLAIGDAPWLLKHVAAQQARIAACRAELTGLLAYSEDQDQQDWGMVLEPGMDSHYTGRLRRCLAALDAAPQEPAPITLTLTDQECYVAWQSVAQAVQRCQFDWVPSGLAAVAEQLEERLKAQTRPEWPACWEQPEEEARE